MLARAQAIGCYPITPQTVIVERLADLVAGRDDVEFANLESEHAMFGYVLAAARVGVRTFTATSSQGLLYAHEQLHRASRERVPLVAVNINRSIFAPWSIQPDLSDSMSQRDTGWIQLYCASAQEVLDSVLCAYRIAEAVMLPVMVCAEGFLLSHTSEVVDVPEQSAVDAFLPELRPPDDWLLDPERPRTFSALPEPDGLRRLPAPRRGRDGRGAGASIETVASEFTTHFGRHKAGALEVAGNPDAEDGPGHDRDDRRVGARAARRRRRPPARPRPRLQAVPRGSALGRPRRRLLRLDHRPRTRLRLARPARARTCGLSTWRTRRPRRTSSAASAGRR